jgi:cysteine desulfuration protein SufE
MTIEEVQQEILDEFKAYDDWMDRYGYLIELGNDLPELPQAEKSDQYLIRGCQSRFGWCLNLLRAGSTSGEKAMLLL